MNGYVLKGRNFLTASSSKAVVELWRRKTKGVYCVYLIPLDQGYNGGGGTPIFTTCLPYATPDGNVKPL